MPEEKQEKESTTRVTVRISIPKMLVSDIVTLTHMVEALVSDLDGAVYDLSLSTPRPMR